ncbi:uncharacterized protein LOC115765847 [Drosophila novamexicana]|uniref:uncharacterized protein LOC115765847 n=1 Tax=Drosophila novamexicana TaxID=47314 RepID=UPI0011E59BF1|nr:uncharacterized protein LOC115765847 [Drosophila novamexicana]
MADEAQSSNSFTSATNLTFATPRTKRKWRLYFKLIDLYRKNECLWMENHKDFFNYDLKAQIWQQIAEEMITTAHPVPTPERWKQLIVKWRYKVQLNQVRRQGAQFYNKVDELPRKLLYSDRFQFLIKHMFDRKKPVKKVVQAPAESEAESVHGESLAAKCMRLGRSKSKSRTFFGEKLQTLEHLRNRRRGTMSLTSEAFHRLP